MFQLNEAPLEIESENNDTVAEVVPIFDATLQVLTEQEAYPILSFVADIGGILGLFIGFNFLMVWELIIWCCKRMYNHYLNFYK